MAKYCIRSFPGKLAPFIYYSILLLFHLTSLGGGTERTQINDSFAIISHPPVKGTDFSKLPFERRKHNQIDFRVVDDKTKYIVLKVSGAARPNSTYFSIDNTSLDSVLIYKIQKDGSLQLVYRGGALIPFNTKRTYVWHTAPLEIKQDPSYYLVTLKASQQNINITYQIIDAHDLQLKYQAYERFVFFYVGVVTILAALIVLAFFASRKIVFAAYLGYIICISGWIISHYGRGFAFLYPNYPVFNQFIKPVTTLAGSFFLILVLQLTFRKNLRSRRWLQLSLQILSVILILLIIAMILLIVPDYQAPLKRLLTFAWHAGLIPSLVLIMSTPLYFFKSSHTARIFSLAMLIICIMTVVQQLGNFGLLNNFFIKEHGMAMASIFEVSIMAYGIFYGIQQENKQKDLQLLRLEQEQSDILKNLISAQDNERKRIAGDLHDNIGPLLAALKINFRRIIHAREGEVQSDLVGKTESIIDESIAEIRNVAFNMMPKGLATKGLINALTEYFESLQQLYPGKIIFNHQIQSIFNQEIQINVYRLICELVLNAARHSNASCVTINIETVANEASIAITDDGKGFEPRSIADKKSLGLESAASRIIYMKGDFLISSEPGKGTSIDIKIPL